MARTAPHAKRRGKAGAAPDRSPMVAERSELAAATSSERAGAARPVAGNTRPRPIRRNSHDVSGNGHEAPDQEMPPATSESAAIAEQPTPLPPRRLQGHIDTVDWSAVNGWVWDPDSPAERIRLELVDGEIPVVTTIASNRRPELVKRGIGDGEYGFSIEFPNEMLAEGRHTLHLRCADSGAAVPGSPIILDYTSLAETPRVMTDIA